MEINKELWDQAEEIVRSRKSDKQLDEMLLDDFVDEVQNQYDRLNKIKF